MTIIAIVITILYLLLIGSFIYGFDKVDDFFLKDLKPNTKFSVVVPFRNEETNLSTLLESIANLNYPKDKYEFLFVDDASEDDSVKIIEKYHFHGSNIPNIKIISNERTTKSPKKDAITSAIAKATHHWIVTTDADCILPKFWLDSFDEFIQRTQAEFIIAPVTYSKTHTFLQRFQLLDVLSLQGTTIGSFGIRNPFLCNGANLAYTKTIFQTVNGFMGNENIGSGDDIFMLEKVAKIYPEKVNYLKCENAIVSTLPQPNFDSLISQRIRWAAKSSAYQNLFAKLVGVLVFLMNGGLLVFSLMTLVGILKWNTFLYLWIIKFGIDFLLIYKAANFMNQKEVMKTYFFAFFMYPFFTVYVVFVSFFRGYDWKGRRFEK